MYLAIVFPLEFECVDPQFWCQLLKSPVIMTVSFLMLFTLFRLLREKDLLGEIYMEYILRFSFGFNSAAIASTSSLMLL